MLIIGPGATSIKSRHNRTHSTKFESSRSNPNVIVSLESLEQSPNAYRTFTCAFTPPLPTLFDTHTSSHAHSNTPERSRPSSNNLDQLESNSNIEEYCRTSLRHLSSTFTSLSKPHRIQSILKTSSNKSRTAFDRLYSHSGQRGRRISYR
jgi:hypothetical protein